MRVRADDFVARAALDDEDLTRSGPPLVVVDLSGSVPDAVEVGALPAVLVGLGDATGSLARSLDLVTDDERVVAAIERSVTATPLAAVALALLLRGRDGRSAAEALVAESMAYSLLQAGPEFVALARRRDAAPPVPADPERAGAGVGRRRDVARHAQPPAPPQRLLGDDARRPGRRPAPGRRRPGAARACSTAPGRRSRAGATSASSASSATRRRRTPCASPAARRVC